MTHQEMYAQLHAMSDYDIQVIWNHLIMYDPEAEYTPGILMDDWVNAAYGEMSRRQLFEHMPSEHPNDSAAGVTMDELAYIFDMDR